MVADWQWLTGISASTPRFRSFVAKKRKHGPLASPPELPQVVISLRQWDGDVGPWKEHFGKGRKQAYPLDGSEPLPSCIEVEVVKRLRRFCEFAFWVSCFNADQLPSRWRPYALSIEELPLWLKPIDQGIRRRIRSEGGGIPDALGWNASSPQSSARFVECKAEHEGIKESQQDWVSMAIAEHFARTQFAVAIRPF